MKILLISKNNYNEYLKNTIVTKCTKYEDIKENLNKEYDAIIIDTTLNVNVLELLNNYPHPEYLNKTIIIDNNYYCYNLLNSPFQLFATINTSKIKQLEYYVEEIEKRNVFYNIDKADIYQEISTILKRLGISPDKDGFHYLRKAIYECYINPTIRNNYTELYTILENTFSISRKDVERSIRYSIFVGYTKSDYEYFEKLFSNILALEQTQPKNSEFIAIVLEELFRIHHKTIY